MVNLSETGFMLFQSIESGVEIILFEICTTAFFYPFMTEKKEWGIVKLKKEFYYIPGLCINIFHWQGSFCL